MIHFGIKKLDDIINLNNKMFILNQGRKGSGYCGFELRLCEYNLLNNLLKDQNPCAVIHLSFGDTFNNLYRLQDGWKNNQVAVEQTKEFDTKASTQIIQYPLFEFKVFGNKLNCILDYIKKFLIGKVKYIFITNYYLSDDKNLNIINSLANIAEENDLTFIIRACLFNDDIAKLPAKIKNCIVEFNKDKESGKMIVNACDNNGNIIVSTA